MWIAGVVLFAASCKRPCDLTNVIVGRAGVGAVDCGHVQLHADPDTTNACVIRAFQAGKPFKALYERMGQDSHAVDGISSAADGTVTKFWYDGDTGGSGGDGNPVIGAQVCEGPTPHAATVGEPTETRPPLDCTKMRDLGRICARDGAA